MSNLTLTNLCEQLYSTFLPNFLDEEKEQNLNFVPEPLLKLLYSSSLCVHYAGTLDNLDSAIFKKSLANLSKEINTLDKLIKEMNKADYVFKTETWYDSEVPQLLDRIAKEAKSCRDEAKARDDEAKRSNPKSKSRFGKFVGI
jgi:hypothetical protein